MNSHIPELAAVATNLVSVAWRDGRESVDFSDHVSAFRRDDGLPDLALDALQPVVAEAMDRFDADRQESDAWLAPRVHSALRMSRREAARRGVWRHIGMIAHPEYVRWRWGSGEGTATPERFHGDATRQAFARLWWGAEQFRDGANYEPVGNAFRSQDLMNNLFRMDICHHRPTAQAAVRVLFPDGGDARAADDANPLSKAANLAATTLMVDILAPDVQLDFAARTDWMMADIDPFLIIESVGEGPADPPVPVASIAAMSEHLAQLLDGAPSRPSRNRTGTATS